MSIKLFFCGDVVSGSSYGFVDESLKEVIKKSDIAVANFEAPIKYSNEFGEGVNKMTPIKKAGPLVCQAKESISYLKSSGFDVLSLANNHIYDYGDEALSKTIEEIKSCGLDYVGAGNSFEEAYKTKIIEKQEVKVGFVAAAENEFGCFFEERKGGGYAWLFSPLVDDAVVALKKEVDVLVVVAHAGVEELNFPIKEWRDRYKRLCALGADVIIGHHPHVPQGHETYDINGEAKLIFYSLGNFFFKTDKSPFNLDDSYSVMLDVGKKGVRDFEIIYHKKKVIGKKKTTMVTRVSEEEVNFSLRNLNDLLFDGYETKLNEACILRLNEYYYDYYLSALGTLSKETNFKEVVIYFIKLFLNKKRYQNNRNLLLLHNIRIDTHRFVVQRALSLMSEKLF